MWGPIVDDFTSLTVLRPQASIAAQIQPTARESLTIDMLKQRAATPVQKSEGLAIDLSSLEIDLGSDDLARADFAESFYSILKRSLSGKKSGGPPQVAKTIGLDLTNAVIKGTFDLTRLGLRVPAYSGVSLPELDDFKETYMNIRVGDRITADTLVLQSPLWLTEACFSGAFNAEGLYFLRAVDAKNAIFTQMANWRTVRFARSADFTDAQFQQESSFQSAIFASRTRFNGAVFNGPTHWKGSSFYDSARFGQTLFNSANFSRTYWHDQADFDQATFQAPITFQKSRFSQDLFLTNAQFEAAANLRQVRFESDVNLRGALIRSQLDLGDARFSRASRINVADLDFNAGEAKLLGSPGQVGQRFWVPSMVSNEAVLQNLVRNFRLIEQVSDANQVEYTTERLRLRQMLHEASELDGSTLGRALHCLVLLALLLLSDYGTNVWLVFGVGAIATTLFGLMFWWVDRHRQQTFLCHSSDEAVPSRREVFSIAATVAVSLAIAFSLLVQCGHPLRSLGAVLLVSVPIPTLILIRRYQTRVASDLSEASYFVKNGATRRLQVLIARLPVIPQYPFYRDRYQPLLTNRRWSWLNYLDFSLNNWFKFGFNDIRLRDKAVPGWVSALVWYQWGLGIIYIALLLWTLSRTIPGLNLLLYF